MWSAPRRLSEYVYSASRKNKDTLHVLVGIAFLVFLVVLFSIVYVVDQRLPTALTITDEKIHPQSFITERAKTTLKALTSIGARITGSYENEVLAVDLLKKEITEIVNSANKGKNIEVNIQIASGAFAWFGIGSSYISAYANVQNVVVKLRGKNSTHSILINAHFDSKPIGRGGSDNGINCANALEVLRKLSKSDEDYEHDLIFLFNGSEEQGLQGSHAFVTQHQWAKDVKLVINLDAAGAGGKMIIFRMGPRQPWLMKYYKSVPYPSGQVLSEEIFGSGMVPSDTDFSIFTGIGRLIGFDMGYFWDGYRYHTSYDGFDNIPNGTYQFGGENLLVLVRSLANAPEIASNLTENASDYLVYYDYLGLFMIYWNETTANVINSITIVLLVVVFGKSIYDLIGFSRKSLWYLIITKSAILSGWILAIVVVTIIAYVLDALNYSLSWFSNKWLLLGLYAVPVFTVTCASILGLNYIKRKTQVSICNASLIQTQLVTLIWGIILLLGTIFGIRSVCFIQLQVAFQILAYTIIIMSSFQHSTKKWVTVYVVCSIIPNLCLMAQAIQVITFFVPVTGRVGASTHSELLIGLAIAFFTMLMTSHYVPLITIIRRPVIIIGILSAIFVLSFILALTPICFPYRGGKEGSPAPQRYYIHHTSRTLRNDANEVYVYDAGFFLSNLDRNAPSYVTHYVSNFGYLGNVTQECKQSLFCGLPFSRYRRFGITWIPAEKPIMEKPVTLKLKSRTTLTNYITRFSFVASGLDYMEVYISPKSPGNLLKIDLIEEKPEAIQLWNGRPLYVIDYVCGKEVAPLKFSIDIETNSSNWQGPLMDIALVGRYLHVDKIVKTEHYSKFVAQFPEWTDVVPWVATYESWVY